MNLMEGTADNGEVRRVSSASTTPVDKSAEKKMHGKVTVGVRPESWRFVSDADQGLPVTVTVVESLRRRRFPVYGNRDVEGTLGNVIIRVSGREHPHKGETPST